MLRSCSAFVPAACLEARKFNEASWRAIMSLMRDFVVSTENMDFRICRFEPGINFKLGTLFAFTFQVAMNRIRSSGVEMQRRPAVQRLQQALHYDSEWSRFTTSRSCVRDHAFESQTGLWMFRSGMEEVSFLSSDEEVSPRSSRLFRSLPGFGSCSDSSTSATEKINCQITVSQDCSPPRVFSCACTCGGFLPCIRSLKIFPPSPTPSLLGTPGSL